MKRRDFLTGGLSLAAGTAAMASTTKAAGSRQLTMVTSWPRDLPGAGTGAQRFANRVSNLSDGKLQITILAAHEKFGPLDVLDTVSEGKADLYHSAAYYFHDYSPAFNFFTGVPMGLTSQELNAWIYQGGGQALWDELGRQFGIKSFLMGNTGPQMGGWFREELQDISSLRNLRIRIPGLGGEVLRLMGAFPLILGAGDIFAAFESGAVDAAEWVGPWNDLALKFHEVAKYYYYPGLHEPGTAFDLSINLDIWSSLPREQREIIAAAAAAENSNILAEYHVNNGPALKTLVDDHGVRLRRFPREITAKFISLSLEVLEAEAAKDPLTRKIYESYRDFRKQSIYWAEYSEHAYQSIR